MCLFVARCKDKYASGVSADVNGIAAGSGRAILWRRANATPAPMDDCLGCLDWSSRLRRHQSHRPGTSAALGTGDTSRAAVRIWRLVAVCVSHARRIRGFEKMAAGTPSSCLACSAALLLLTPVLCCLGHLRPGAAFDPGG